MLYGVKLMTEEMIKAQLGIIFTINYNNII